MIQNFNVQGGPEFGQKNLPKLREKLAKLGLDGFLVPHEDEFNNEYLPDCNERLMWVSGFTGSAGFAVVLKDKAAIFVDGRYTLQVRAQVDGNLFSYHALEAGGLAKWLAKTLKSGMKIGYDPRLHSPAALEKLQKAVEEAGASLIAVAANPIDEVWDDRPAPPRAKLEIQPLDLAGLDHEHKRKQIAKTVAQKGAQAALITSPASIAWLLNIRGGDVMCTPLPLATAILHKDASVELFIHPDKITPEIRAHFGNAVSISDEDKLVAQFQALKGKTVIVDPQTSSSFMFEQFKKAGVKVKPMQDPIALPKAMKNDAEIAGTTKAHIRDGAAMAKFLHWLDTEAQSGTYDEIEAAQKLEHFRAQSALLKDLSFESISGAGSNGAIVHYRVSTATVKPLARGSLYLIDSGAQYVDGTTDITRTVPIGTPDAEMRRTFTLVLKGHIALARIRFPHGTSGHALDVLARAALWMAGLDYAHGTGHGVGVYLGVHEGPQRIANVPNTVPLEPGMIVSNEPGYYKTGAFGIRIENLQYVTKPAPIPGGEIDMLGFQTLTLVPIHKALIDTPLLHDEEINWVNTYHRRVYEEISPLVDKDTKDWLKTACAPIEV